ncbi:MAG: flagellar biosynthesis repressor FlbT [Rhodobacteraceae bacterium]|nr:flagellar biosynthesis repressor FlbT [Paracoccaceae bacterium]
MAGLVLKLAPNERILINGVVIENGERKTVLKIKTPNAAILRLRDALHPDDAKTPITRAYYAAQMRVAGESDDAVASAELDPKLDELSHVFEDGPHASAVEAARAQLRKRNFYGVMRALKPLIDVEKELLAQQDAASASTDQDTAPEPGAAGSVPVKDAPSGEDP